MGIVVLDSTYITPRARKAFEEADIRVWTLSEFKAHVGPQPPLAPPQLVR